MALARTIFMGIYRSVLGPGNALRVVQGGSSAIALSEYHLMSSESNYVKQAFAFNGQVYIPMGSAESGSNGWQSYSPELNKMFLNNSMIKGHRIIPFGDRVGYFNSNAAGWGEVPERWAVNAGGVASRVCYDYAIVENYICMISSTQVYVWSYPFEGGTSLQTLALSRVCELDGVIYGIKLNDNSTSYLYKLFGANMLQVGSGFTFPADNDRIAGAPPTVLLFGFNSKLYVAFATQTGATWRVRCHEVNTSTGALGTDQGANLPAAWKVGHADSTQDIFEIRDDAGATEQVFIVRAGGTAIGGWEMYEFVEGGAWTLVHSGAEAISPPCGVIFDEGSTKGADIKGSVINQAGNYAMLEIGVSERIANAVADIDPRYRDLIGAPTQDPPYSVMTEKGAVGSEGKTNLTSKPAGITVLSDLDDSFADNIIDTELWRIVNPCYYPTTFRDIGFGYSLSPTVAGYTIEETGGALRPGDMYDTYISYNGIGVKGKWFISGDFTIDITVVNTDNLRLDTTRRYWIGAVLKTVTNRGYGFRVFNLSGTIKARGVFYEPEGAIPTGTPTESADSAAVAATEVFRITRAAGVWVITRDPGGLTTGPEVITPAGGVNYTEDVYLVLYGCTTGTLIWPSASPAPGFSQVSHTGAGSLGRYDDFQKHDFAWDFGTDIGTGAILSAEPYVDTN